jgi:hypothetical protein
LLALDALRRGSGLNPKGPAANGILLPLCTGMSTSLLLSSLRTSENSEKTVVLWIRIDKKSCFKATVLPVQVFSVSVSDEDLLLSNLSIRKLELG